MNTRRQETSRQFPVSVSHLCLFCCSFVQTLSPSLTSVLTCYLSVSLADKRRHNFSHALVNFRHKMAAMSVQVQFWLKDNLRLQDFSLQTGKLFTGRTWASKVTSEDRLAFREVVMAADTEGGSLVNVTPWRLGFSLSALIDALCGRHDGPIRASLVDNSQKVTFMNVT